MSQPEVEVAIETEGAFVFARDTAGHGRLRLRPLRDPDDFPLVHGWVSREYARFWGMTGHSLDQVTSGYRAIARNADVFIGEHDGEAAFLVERYDPARDAIGRHYGVQPGDRGMHVLVAPSSRPVRGFSWAVFSFVMDFLFDDPAVSRVVVEPDVRNAKIHALNRRAGFRYDRLVELPHKTAHLAFCTRAQRDAAGASPPAGAPAAHLRADVWAAADRGLVRKAIAELAHERVLQPKLEQAEGTWGRYVLRAVAARAEYRFRARVLPLDHWDVDAASIERWVDEQRTEVGAMDFVLDMAETLNVAAATLPIYLEEIASTLYGAAYKRHHQRTSAADLLHADFQEIEAAMAEGHPSFVANSGRVGFDAADHARYAPEAAAPVRLIWLAAHKRRCEATVLDELAFDAFLERELGGPQLADLLGRLRAKDLDPNDYHLVPVHPWQWFNKLATLFAPDLAAGNLVCLGYGADAFRAQQSVRTFFNTSQPNRCYVKTALSVLNMGFMRGLSADYMRNTPAICAWVDALVKSDALLQSKRFSILREVAGAGYRNPLFEAALPKSSPHRKMLAALWRESPVPTLAPGQRLMTMAALLHRDRDGAALLPLLVQASGLGVDAWLDRYLDCYLVPLVHCLQRHALAFMPHGENVILVLENHAPVRAIMKDIAEEVAVMNVDAAARMPERVRRICVDVPEAVKPLSIFTDVFDGILRYLAQILLEQAAYPVERFWQRVGACIAAYDSEQSAAGHPVRHDLFTPTFPRSCLNRLQLANNRQMLDLTDPAGGLKFAGTLDNPIAHR